MTVQNSTLTPALFLELYRSVGWDAPCMEQIETALSNSAATFCAYDGELAVGMARLLGDGGWPSGHSATVTSLAMFAGLRCGFHSFEFAAAAVFAIVVCHDAMGVRLETGKQAEIINELVEAFERISKEKVAEEKLKIFVGHTPIQVLAGIAIGAVNALLMNLILPW